MSNSEAKPMKKHFAFEALRAPGAVTIGPGDGGGDVDAMQTFLTEAGYLRGQRQSGHMCESTCGALRRFQTVYHLEATGVADTATLNLMQKPRCGVPDIEGEPQDGAMLDAFTLVGCRYNTNALTYAFQNGTDDLPGTRGYEIVREAFGVWSAVSPLSFTEVGVDQSPTFTIAWEHRHHGDGFPFDDSGSMTGNTLAHAFFPPHCGGVHAGELHFDEFENWTDAAAPGRIRLLNVAIHEIGHLLGLRHSNDQNAIMFAFYDDAVDSLRPDDIAGIQAIYGAP